MNTTTISSILSIRIWIDTVIGIINLHILLCKVLEGRLRRKTAMICLIVLVCTAIASLLSGYHLVAEVLSLPVVILLPLLTVTRIPKRTILYVGLLYGGLTSIVLYCTLWVVAIFTPEEWPVILVNTILDIGWLCLFSAMAAQKISNKIFRQLDLLSGGLKGLVLAFLWCGSVLMEIMRTLFEHFWQIDNPITLQITSAILVALICICCPVLIINYFSNVHFKNLSKNMTQQVEAQVKHYQQMAQANADIRAFRHDFKNLQIGLQQHLNDKDINSALACLQQYDASVFQNVAFETGNRVADAMLTSKRETAIKQNTTLSFSGRLSASLPSTDVCILLGNAVDNALEACQKLPAGELRRITITAHNERGMQFLQIENPLPSGIILPANGALPVTTKPNAAQHGFGIAAMKRVVENYRGTLQFTCKNGLVVLEIEFTLP